MSAAEIMPASDPALAVTFFPDWAANTFTERTLTLSQMRGLILSRTADAKAKLPLLKLARFGDKKSEKNSLRHDGNVLAISGLEADYDGGVMTFEEAVERATKGNVLSIVYTTPLHSPEKPGWRVLAPFSTELPPQARGHHFGRLNGLYQGIFAGESWTLSQSYFFGSVRNNPAHQAVIINGTPIDQLDELDEVWIGKPVANGGSASVPGQRSRMTDQDEAALIANIMGGKELHVSSIRLLGRWSNQGVSWALARQRLREAFEAIDPAQRDQRWRDRYGDIDRLLEDVYVKDAKKRDQAENGMLGRHYAQDNTAPEEDAAPPLGERYKHLTLLSPADCAVSPSRGYVVKGLIAPGDVAICFGHPGSGKSIIAPHIAYGIAQGREVFRRKVREGLVFYVPAEDPHGMRQRIHALQIEHGDVSENFRIIEGVGNLLGEDSADRHALLELVDEQRPALIVIDTIAAAFRGLRENDADHMAQVTGYARMLARNGTAVLLMHHSPKADDSTPRGHGNLAGDADMTIKLSIEASSGVCTGTLLKNRNGPSGTTMAFSIKAAKVGTDEDGDTLTAPLAVEMDSAPARRKKLSQNETTARRFLADLIAVKGKPLPAGPLSPNLPCVPEEDWRAECESRRLSSCTEKKDRTKTYTRAVRGLQSQGVISIRDGLVWLADAGKSA